MKRFLDLFCASIGLVLLLPLYFLVSIFIFSVSPGSVLYKGKRVGLGGKPFYLYKFRTMVLNAETLGGPSTALNDPRLIKGGRLLRKFKLDEIPQLLNVLKGEMSLVGPRPQVDFYTSQYTGENMKILNVKPGVTDYASLYFIDLDSTLGSGNVDEIYATKIEPVKNRLRVKYVKDIGMVTDLKIIIMTILSVLGIKRKWNILN